MVTLDTNKGKITIELNYAKAPISCDNFINYVKDGFYDNTIFHRVIKGFMIQGGGFTNKMEQKSTNNPISNEANNGLTNDKYSVAMARTNEPHSASSQFFINTNDNAFLNYPGQDGWGYAVFAKVISGFGVIDEIENVPTTNYKGHNDVPASNIIIQSASILSDNQFAKR